MFIILLQTHIYNNACACADDSDASSRADDSDASSRANASDASARADASDASARANASDASARADDSDASARADASDASARAERRIYQQMVEASKTACAADNRVLAASQLCSYEKSCHYSFDFAQQVHLPHEPMQRGPVYFVCPRKVGIFGLCCEGLPRQVNFLIDESHCTSKGSTAVISYLHFFFEQYCLREREVDLHCENCCGQNKNNFVLASHVAHTGRTSSPSESSLFACWTHQVCARLVLWPAEATLS